MVYNKIVKSDNRKEKISTKGKDGSIMNPNNLTEKDKKTLHQFLKQQFMMVNVRPNIFGMSASMPTKYVPKGKTIMLNFFPEFFNSIMSLKAQPANFVAKRAVSVNGQSFMFAHAYDSLCEVINDSEAAINNIVSEQILPNLDDLRADYIARVNRTAEQEGIIGEDKDKVLREMTKKFPNSFPVSFRVNVLSFPEADVSGLDENIADAVSKSHSDLDVETYKSLIGSRFDSLFTVAMAVEKGMSKNGVVANKTRGSVSSTYVNVSDDNKRIGLSLLDEALVTFKKLFIDTVDEVTPSYAKLFAANVYKAAMDMGVERFITIKDIDLNVKDMLEIAESIGFAELNDLLG